MKARCLLQSILFVLFCSSLGLASEVPPVAWERLSTDGSDSVQFLGVGRKGEVELFRMEPPGVFRFDPDGSLQPLLSIRGERKRVHRAVRERQGESWFLLLGVPLPELALLQEDGRMKSLPLPDRGILGIGWMGDSPVVVTLPYDRKEPRPKGEPPLVMRFDGEKWRALLHEPYKVPLPFERDPRKEISERQLLLASAPEGRLWLVNEYRYRIRLLSPGGRVLLDVDLGREGLPRRRKPEVIAAEEATMRERAKREGFPKPGKDVHFLPMEFSPVLSGVAEGPDGRLYLLSSPGQFGEGMVLDRFDPTTMELERLRTVGIEPPSRFSMVAAADGLYVAGFRESLGRWRLSWEELEAAPWELVKAMESTVSPEESPETKASLQ